MTYLSGLRTALIVYLCAISAPALSQFDPRFMESHSVRVVAKSSSGTFASSGFLWKSSSQVVTSLHGVPGGSQITVECQGVKRAATVLKTLAKSDLILLGVNGLPSTCEPFTSANKTKPEPYTHLWTFGYHAGARSGTSRRFEKGYATDEKLSNLVSGAPLTALKSFGIPSINLDIYYVEGGLLPGYSGGPVVDKNRRLIGIVDGGLNKGQSAYNWVIPAKYLDELENSNTSSIPPQVASSGGQHFSSGIVDADESNTVEYVKENEGFGWVLTKTQSLSVLAATADDAEGVGGLLDIYAKAASVTNADQLVFDIYEDQERGLVIAVPAGQALGYFDYDDEQWLMSLDNEGSDQYSGLRFAHNDWEVHNENKELITPESPDYWQHLMTEMLIDCHDPGIVYCFLDDQVTRMIDFGGGNKILRAGVSTYDFATNQLIEYDYYSFAVKDNKPFGAQARILPNGATGLIECRNIKTPVACQDPSLSQNQLSQLIAAHLTSFSGLAGNADYGVLETEFYYDSRWDDPSTIYIPYYEGTELRFFNTRGYEWKVYFDNEWEYAKEIRRDESDAGTFVVLEYMDTFYSLPVKGGDYFQAQGDQWVLAGSVQPTPPAFGSQ
ncbi:MAG: serine protease [Pseudomonadota bacterium]